jgi:ATP-dependent protease Clp ATPase subunit
VARIGGSGEELKCSFGGEDQRRVQKLIAGPDVCICNQCVDLCYEIMEDEGIFHPRRHPGSFDPKLLLREWIEDIDLQDSERVRETRRVLEELLSRLN